MFSNLVLRSFRILLLPFAVLYWIGISVRNWLYNRNILRSSSFALPIICVGNLSVGGTGKSPMIEYLVELLQEQFRLAIVSRGYKRKTTGYTLANEQSTALDIGDEPMQFHQKFPNIPVAVGEERLVAIPQLLHDRPNIELVLLDDAFQHRAIRAGLNILLTDYNNLFTRDFYIPAGDLRDLKSSYKRAEIIIVTKCNPRLPETEKEKIIEEIKPRPGQLVCFSSIEYGRMYHITTRAGMEFDPETEVLLVSGIANPRPLKRLLEEHSNSYVQMQYADHHIFTIDDLKDIRKRFTGLDATKKIILTTEKDAVRLSKFADEIASLPLYVIPIRHHFLFDDGEKFATRVREFIINFKKRD